MERTELRVHLRGPGGKARALRRAGRLPGIYYGGGEAPVAIETDVHEFVKRGLATSSGHLVRLESDTSSLGNQMALIREVQSHPVSGVPVHFDLLRVDINKPVETTVPLAFVGKPLGIVEGGILQPLRRELEVRALPNKLPELLEVDVSALGIHDVIHVADLRMPEGVEALYAENFSIVVLMPPVVEKAPVEEEAEALEGEAVAAGTDQAAEGRSETGSDAE